MKVEAMKMKNLLSGVGSVIDVAQDRPKPKIKYVKTSTGVVVSNTLKSIGDLSASKSAQMGLAKKKTNIEAVKSIKLGAPGIRVRKGKDVGSIPLDRKEALMRSLEQRLKRARNSQNSNKK